MKKGIIIIGPSMSGKTRKAREIADQFQENEVAFIDAKNNSNSHRRKFINECTGITKLIIIDEFKASENIDIFYPAISEGIITNNKHHQKIRIRPQIIVVCRPEITRSDLPTGGSFTHRFDIIECTESRKNERESAKHDFENFGKRHGI